MAISTFKEQPNITHLWAAILVEELVRQGVTYFCIAPGSRSTPLTLAAAQHPDTTARVHVDERGAAFMALGYGRAGNGPAAVITTSGTAVANLLPAVVEASTDYVPMLLLTADRPPELRDTGANQTIDQVKIFGSYVRWQMDLPAPSTEISPKMLLTTAGQAVARASRTPGGPVHLNCMFRKPLAPIPDDEDYSNYLATIENWADGDNPYTRYSTPSASIIPEDDEWLNAERGIIVAGTLPNPADQQAALQLAELLSWPLLPDIRSGIRLGPAAWNDFVIPYADQILTSSAFRKRHKPDVVVHLGGRIVSKRLLSFVSDAALETYAIVREEPDRLDPHHHVTHRVEASVASFVDAVGRRDHASALWTESWRSTNDAVSEAVTAHLPEKKLTEPLVADLVTRHVPQEHALFVASSMPVRDVNRYGSVEGESTLVAANRGASGIDGVVSTSVGWAAGTDRVVTLIVGDLALLHDLNSLQLLTDTSVIVIAVNNDGGGIFHFLPVVDHSDQFEPFFGTPHGYDFRAAAEMFNIRYAKPSTSDDFVEVYQRSTAEKTSTLIEVQTDRTANKRLHERLEQHIAEAVDDLQAS